MAIKINSNGKKVFYKERIAQITPLVNIKCILIQYNNTDRECWIEILENKYQFEIGQRFILPYTKIINIK
jgi:hypothetical protein